jgi:8-oxo-dGTP pyrophosphatase MutT (NUDIX family)
MADIVTDIVAKAAVFDEDGRLLVLTRSQDDSHRPGGMDFPGGRVNEGEAIVAGVLRELTEEAGLQLQPQDVQLCFAYTYIGERSESGQTANFVWLGFVAAMPADQQIQLSHEHSTYRWLSVEECVQTTDSKTQRLFIEHLQLNGLIGEGRHGR